MALEKSTIRPFLKISPEIAEIHSTGTTSDDGQVTCDQNQPFLAPPSHPYVIMPIAQSLFCFMPRWIAFPFVPHCRELALRFLMMTGHIADLQCSAPQWIYG